MLFSVIICRIWSFATAINKLLFDKNCHICNSYQKGAIFYQSHKVFYTTCQYTILLQKCKYYLVKFHLKGLTQSITPQNIEFSLQYGIYFFAQPVFISLS